MRSRFAFSACCALVLASGCGGKVEVGGGGAGGTLLHEDVGGGGGASVIGTATSSSTVSTSSTTGAGGAPPIPALVETDLGSFAPGAQVAFDIPPSTLGFSLFVEPQGKLERIGVETLQPPAGAPVIEQFGIDAVGWEFAWYGITVAAVPQSDAPSAIPPAPGTWTAKLASPENNPGPATVKLVRRQTVDGLFHGGVLDVNVFIAGDAADPIYMNAALADAYDGFAGLSLGTVTYYTLPDAYSIIDSYDAYFAALEQTKIAGGAPALDVVVVAELAGPFDGAGGVASSIPGQGLEHGTHASGLVMTVSENDVDVNVLRHEGGHVEGLFHTTEIVDASLGDALGDTPKCDDVQAMGLSCPDATNVMFPYAAGGAELSPEQLAVVHGSALYRGVVEEGGAPAPPLSPTGGSQGASEEAMTPPAHRAIAAAATRASRPIAARSWSSALPPGAARMLASVWCGDPRAPVDHYAVLRGLGGDDPVLLAAIAADPRAPKHVRARALAAAGRLAPPPEVIDVLASTAASREAPRALRLAALDGLGHADAARARVIAEALAGDRDAIVARAAARAR